MINICQRVNEYRACKSLSVVDIRDNGSWRLADDTQNSASFSGTNASDLPSSTFKANINHLDTFHSVLVVTLKVFP